MAISGRAGAGLRGRDRECELLDRMLARVRTGQSSALVLRGEPGAGKTALLDYVRERASGCRLAHVVGVESEMELAFAGLHQLCAPMLDRLDRLPEPQRDALRVAFGLHEGGVPDRFMVGLAVLTLLSEAAAERPLVCLVDDAQWLDRASVQAMSFAARRLLAEPVAVVFAVREPNDDHDLADLPELSVNGLGSADAAQLLASVMHGRLDEQVRDRIIAETRGNPLALLELPRVFTPAELAGGFGLPNPGPVSGCLEQCFTRRIRAVPGDTQRLLLTAAADPSGDAGLLWRAVAGLGLSAAAAGPAEAAGLIEIGGRVRFRHPLVRSVVYRTASPDERQRVHRALGEATDPEVDPDRRAWHRARAARGSDEVVAGELERSADRAHCRGGIAAAAAFLAKATELTPDPARRGARALAAAQQKLDAGAPDASLGLLAIAEAAPLDELQHARADLLRAEIALAVNRGRDAPPLLLRAAERLEPLDVALSRETYLEALEAAIFTGRVGNCNEALRATEAARRAPQRPIDLLLDGLAARFTDGFASGVPTLQRAVRAFRRSGTAGTDDARWIGLACRVATDLGDDEAWRELAARGLRRARDTGALTTLATALSYRAGEHVHAGELDVASEMLDEADAIAQTSGNAPHRYAEMTLAATRGREAQALELIETSTRDADARGEGRAITMADYATAVLDNGLGKYETAAAAAERACRNDQLSVYWWALGELVEAGVRSGRREVAEDAFRRLHERTRACGTNWASGIEARSLALLSTGEEAEKLYREAVERLARSRAAVHLARTHLLHGEWLRRENRRLEAREQLRTAHEMFGRIGTEAFAERARRELLATGETVHRATPQTLVVLTAQEAQIARLARDGHTNPEIGAQLFLSPRTVEWHLRKVFTKLAIGSRRELRRVLSSAALADSRT
ncbi:ATP-binding protein [Saccharopolyspora elongata]|uniref:Helix-turn-helix transcriptional regulator n=1 Tax=Saccharopolyspora elongata TaxID=2530387 RepID=A0A4V2YP07_9PSEU|nr:LuxR family transcriptional regulator [Saccharopolyspora elongata]TDD55917.1 helix-turn-helix transcriptional regulator [Saccharopolyspora elongata]